MLQLHRLDSLDDVNHRRRQETGEAQRSSEHGDSSDTSAAQARMRSAPGPGLVSSLASRHRTGSRAAMTASSHRLVGTGSLSSFARPVSSRKVSVAPGTASTSEASRDPETMAQRRQSLDDMLSELNATHVGGGDDIDAERSEDSFDDDSAEEGGPVVTVGDLQRTSSQSWAI